MTNYEFGEVVLVEFYQTGTTVRKRRPALVILDIGDADVILAPITTRERTGPGDYQIKDWRNSGLVRESWVRLAKISCLEKSDIICRRGKFTDGELEEVVRVLRSLFLDR